MTRLRSCLLAAVTALSLLASPAPAQDDDKANTIVIGGGTPFGLYFGASGAICRAWSGRFAEARCLSVANGDSAENLAALESGAVDFAIVQSDWLMHAVKGTSRFRADGPNDELRAVLSLPGDALTVLARKALGAENVKQLAGRRIGYGVPRSYAYLLMRAAAKASGIDLDAPTSGNGVAGDGAEALCKGEIDALATVASHPAGWVAELMARCDLSLITLDSGSAKSAIRSHPELAQQTVPAGVYTGTQPEVRTIALRGVLVGLKRTDNDTVHALAKAVFDQLDELRRGHPAFSRLEPRHMVADGITAPLHDGAKKYYDERKWK